MLTGVYAITDPVLLADDDTLLDAVTQALAGGAHMVQYRNKHARSADQYRQSAALQELCASANVPLLINDNVELSQQIGAAGVHLGQSDLGLAEARQLLGPDAIIGISCHASARLAIEAQQNGASYIAVGRFFPSRTKPQAPAATLEDLREIRRTVEVPLVAIGGINAENGAALVGAGADMLAAIHHLFSTSSVEEHTRELTLLFQRSK